MKVVIVHYHLQTGGVTRVIEHACQVLTEAGHQVLILAGEPPQQPLPPNVNVEILPALAYEERRTPLGPTALAAAMCDAVRRCFATLPDLWHLHNHSLGKNLAMPGVIAALVRQGERLLLQPHDFAEDGRPALYRRQLDHAADGDADRLSTLLYPLSDRVHYAVLNDRDRGFLATAGIPDDRLHLLPNAVSIPRCATPNHPFGECRLWLYPTRAIRRKNLGELLLWASLAEEQDLFATTQAPQNPAEQARYQRWVALAQELDLPLEFELGNRVDDFAGLLAAAHALVTTSVAEGFGLAFLEPWLVNRPLTGRNLPEITRDFAAAGIDLGALYDRLDVPLEWIDTTRLRHTMARAFTSVMSDYGRTTAPDQLERLWNTVTDGDCIDFGRLDEIAQEEVLRHLASTPDACNAMQPNRLSSDRPQAPVAANHAITVRDYALPGYGRRLDEIYTALMSAGPDGDPGAADGTALMDCFLAPERLSLLRT